MTLLDFMILRNLNARCVLRATNDKLRARTLNDNSHDTTALPVKQAAEQQRVRNQGASYENSAWTGVGVTKFISPRATIDEVT